MQKKKKKKLYEKQKHIASEKVTFDICRTFKNGLPLNHHLGRTLTSIDHKIVKICKIFNEISQ